MSSPFLPSESLPASDDGSPHGRSIQVSDEGRDQQPNYEVSLRPRKICRQESQEDGTNNNRQRTDSFRDSRVTASVQQHHGTMIFATPRSALTPGDTIAGSPQKQSSEATSERLSSGEKMVTGYEESTAHVSAECASEAEEHVTGILREDCHPFAISVLVCNDNNQTLMTNPNEPPFDAVESCSLLKDAMESYGVMAIPVVNRSKEYLNAILANLASREIPKSCQFLWFIFSGHGRRNSFFVNKDSMEFDTLIRKAAEITAIRCMAFFIDCCQLYNWKGIKVVDIEKEHMTLYSAPPYGKSFHKDGVGLMVTCLAEMLACFKGSLNDLQLELREKLVEKMVDTFPVSSDELDKFREKHLPQHTSTMFGVHLYNEICNALRPKVSVEFRDGNHEACVTVQSPKRIMHHKSRSKFELSQFKYVLATGRGQASELELDTTAATFDGDTTHHVIKLPPQVCKVTGSLKVGAVYRDGRVEFSEPMEVDLPCYGKPSITSCTIENECVVSVAYNPSRARESEAYHIEYIEIGFFEKSQWRSLERKEGYNYTQRISVVLPVSLSDVKRELQVAVKYKSCSTIIYSDTRTVDQPAVSRPEITTVAHVDSLTGKLKFAPKQPSQHDRYRVCRYAVKLKLENAHLMEVYCKIVPQGESLSCEEDVTFPLPLVEQTRMCEYHVTMQYFDTQQEVRSVDYAERLNPSGVPTIKMTKTRLLGHKLTVSFAHPDSYPKESALRDQLKYDVVQIDTSKRSSDVTTTVCPSTSDNVEITVGLASSFKVEVYYGNRRELGIISSETYKSNEVYHQCCSVWNLVPSRVKVLMALLSVFVVLSALAVFFGVHYPLPMGNQLIVVEQTTPFQIGTFSRMSWCDGVLAREYTVEFSDFVPGFNISVYLVSDSDLKPENITIPSSEYPYVEEYIDFSNDEEHYLLPLNYYQNPPFLLDGSVMKLRCTIDMPNSADDLSYAVIYFFNSMDDAVAYQQWKGSSKPVHSINVTECAKEICTKSYDVIKKSFYFPVLSTKADSEYQITVNFTFDVKRYVNPSTLPSAVNVANFSKSSSGEIPFHDSKVVLLYAHPPNATAYERLAHLHFSCVPHYALQVPVYLVGIVLEAVFLGVYCCWWYRKCKKTRNRKRLIDAMELPT